MLATNGRLIAASSSVTKLALRQRDQARAGSGYGTGTTGSSVQAAITASLGTR